MAVSVPKRKALFWGVCIPLRLYLASLGDVAWLRLFGLVIGARWVSGRENGDEGMFGGKAWWKEERGLHGVLWLLYAGSGDRRFLQADVTVGMLNWAHTYLLTPI